MDVKRMKKCLREAIWTVQNYVMDETGKRPTQEEIARALMPYLVLNEVIQHIKAMRETEE